MLCFSQSSPLIRGRGNATFILRAVRNVSYHEFCDYGTQKKLPRKKTWDSLLNLLIYMEQLV